MNDGLVRAKLKAEHLAPQAYTNYRDYNSEDVLKHVIDRCGIDTFDYPFDSNISGMLVSDSRSITLTTNSKMSKERGNFSKGHELGHYFQHVNDTCKIYSFQDVVGNSIYQSQEELQRESEADMFAGHLLLPDYILIAFLRKGHSFSSICKQVVISKPALRFRIKELLTYTYSVPYWEAHNIVMNFENVQKKALLILITLASNNPVKSRELFENMQYKLDV